MSPPAASSPLVLKAELEARIAALGQKGPWPAIAELDGALLLLLEPCTGTWGRIAADMGRRWIGADIATTLAPAYCCGVDQLSMRP